MSISSSFEIFFRHLSKYFMYFTNKLLEKVKSLFSFFESSITWIIIESLKLALSILDNKDEVYYPAAELAVWGWLLIPVFIAVVTAGVLFASPTIAFPTYD